jgi:hypothetical protein
LCAPLLLQFSCAIFGLPARSLVYLRHSLTLFVLATYLILRR